VIAGGNVHIERLPIPGIVDAEAMPARSDWNGDSLAIHEFVNDPLAVELHYDLAKLDVVRRGTPDGDLRFGSLRRNRRHGAHRQEFATGATAKSGCATYFLKRSSKACRASLWRGGGGAAAVVPFCA
jgi:hypothetical protein